MDTDEAGVLLDLLRGQRWAALATCGEREPLASMVAFVAEPDLDGFLLHLSELAAHTRNLVDHGQASLVIGAPDLGGGDPQTLARVTIGGSVALIAPGTAEHALARQRYLGRLPAAEPRFSFGDFRLFRLVPRELRFVGGFARARTLSPAALQGLLRAVPGPALD
jgi:putative heme iron utilization protein